MKKTLILVCLCACASLFAAPSACVPATAATYTSQGSCTITVNGIDWTISDVKWTSLGSFTESDTQVELSPVYGPGLAFTFIGGLSVPAGQTMLGHFQYVIDPPPPILDGFGVTLDPTGASSLSGTILYAQKHEDDFGPVFDKTGSFTVNASGFAATHYVLSDFKQFNFPANYVSVNLFIRVGGGDQPATALGGVTSATPEPVSFALAGAGLIAFAMLGRKAVRR